tara:strand:- start:852 stop:1265 length:414 start_codon:yes stop_codon:yes gene_type:complete
LSNNITDKDKKDWQDFIDSKEKLNNKDITLDKKKIRNIRTIDFHGYSLKKANLEIENLIKKSYLEKVSKLIVVTGKGIHSNVEKDPYVSKDLSILKYSVPEYIKNNEELSKYINYIEEASNEDGGSGAFYIYLKKNK